MQQQPGLWWWSSYRHTTRIHDKASTFWCVWAVLQVSSAATQSLFTKRAVRVRGHEVREPDHTILANLPFPYAAAAAAKSPSVVSNSVQPHRWQPTRLPRLWDSPGKKAGVGCHFLLQWVKVKRESEVAQSPLTPSDAMDCSPPGSSIHGIF